jgi:hypothetical protein
VLAVTAHFFLRVSAPIHLGQINYRRSLPAFCRHVDIFLVKALKAQPFFIVLCLRLKPDPLDQNVFSLLFEGLSLKLSNNNMLAICLHYSMTMQDIRISIILL